MDLAELIDLLSRGGAMGAAALVIWALLTGRLVTPGVVDAERQRTQDQKDRVASLLEQRQEAMTYNRQAFEKTRQTVDDADEKLTVLIGKVDTLADLVRAQTRNEGGFGRRR